MPIEIKELHIRVSVNTPAGGKPAGAPGPDPGADGRRPPGARRRVRRAGAAGPPRPEGALSAMAATGKLEKMLILAFDTAEDAESGGALEAKERFEALINPETYTLEYKVKTADGQGQGTSGAQIKFEYTLPEELTFDFLFDNTGLIDGKPSRRASSTRSTRSASCSPSTRATRTSRTTSSSSGGT